MLRSAVFMRSSEVFICDNKKPLKQRFQKGEIGITRTPR